MVARIAWRMCLVVAGLFATVAAMALWSGRMPRGYLLGAVAIGALVAAGVARWRYPPPRHR